MAVIVPNTVFEYTIDSDGTFPDKQVDIPTFIEEIEASAISQTLVSVTIVGGNCRIEFAGNLSDAEIAILDGLVTSHSATRTTEPHTLPFIWQKKNPAAGQASTKMNVMGLDGSIDAYALLRKATITGAQIRFKNALTAGTITITVTKNGVATTKNYVHDSTKGQRKLWLINPGKVTFEKGDTLGFRWESSVDMLPAGDNEIDINAETMWL